MKWSRVIAALASLVVLSQANQSSASHVSTLHESIGHEFVQPILKSSPSIDSNTAAIHDAFPDELEIEIPHSSRTFNLKLIKSNDLLSPDYVSTIVDVDSETNEIRESVQAISEKPDCYYHGTVAGEQGSVVAIDLCSNSVVGFIQTSEKTLSLESAAIQSNIKGAVRERSATAAINAPIVVVDVSDERRHLDSVEKSSSCGSSPSSSHDSHSVVRPAALEQTYAMIQERVMQELNDEVHPDESSRNRLYDLWKNRSKTIPAANTEAETTNTNTNTNTNTSANADTNVSSDEGLKSTLTQGKTIKYVEVVAFNDHARYKEHGDDTYANTLQLLNNIASYYRYGNFKYDVRIVLKSQVTFQKGDPYTRPLKNDGSTQVTGANGLLNLFNLYRANNLNTFRSHDLGLLLSGNTFESSIRGLANVGSVCAHPTLSGNVCQVTYRNAVMNSVLTAHELGHNLGMQHDGQGYNQCTNNQHIMQPYVSSMTSFSECSKAYLTAHMDVLTCMNNNPHQSAITDVDEVVYNTQATLLADDKDTTETKRKSDDETDNGNDNKHGQDQEIVYIDQDSVFVMCLITAVITALIVTLVVVVTLKAKQRRQETERQLQLDQQQQQLPPLPQYAPQYATQQQQPALYPTSSMYTPCSQQQQLQRTQ